MFDFQVIPYHDPLTNEWSTQAVLDCEGMVVNVFFATWSISGDPLVWEETHQSEEELWNYLSDLSDEELREYLEDQELQEGFYN